MLHIISAQSKLRPGDEVSAHRNPLMGLRAICWKTIKPASPQ